MKLKSSSNKIKCTILLICSLVLFNSKFSFAEDVSGITAFYKGEEIKNSQIDMVGDNLKDDKKKRNFIEVVKTINLFINENLKDFVSPIDIQYYKNMTSFELNTIINSKLNDIYSVVKKKKLYSKFLPFILGIAEEDLIEPLSGICEFIKENKKRKEFKGCNMPNNCDVNYNKLSQSIYKCFYNTSSLSCGDIFDVYDGKRGDVYYYNIPGEKTGGGIYIALRLGKESKPTSFPTDSVVYLEKPVEFNALSFCNDGSIGSSELDYYFNVLKRIHKLSDTDTTAYATTSFIKKCGHELLGERTIEKKCIESGKEYIKP